MCLTKRSVGCATHIYYCINQTKWFSPHQGSCSELTYVPPICVALACLWLTLLWKWAKTKVRDVNNGTLISCCAPKGRCDKCWTGPRRVLHVHQLTLRDYSRGFATPIKKKVRNSARVTLCGKTSGVKSPCTLKPSAGIQVVRSMAFSVRGQFSEDIRGAWAHTAGPAQTGTEKRE